MVFILLSISRSLSHILVCPHVTTLEFDRWECGSLIVATERRYQTQLTFAILQIAESAPPCWQIYIYVMFVMYTHSRVHTSSRFNQSDCNSDVYCKVLV